MLDTVTRVNLNKNARFVLEKRYLRRKGYDEIIETPEGMFRRVAQAIASVESRYDGSADAGDWAERFERAMAELWFLPSSTVLLNAGKPGGQLAASCVVPVADSLDSIFDAVKQTAIIHKKGAGTGFNFSAIRPKGDAVDGRNGVACGPVELISVFAGAANMVRQGGIRRGCNSVALRSDHPDIREFIRAKADKSVLKNFYTCVLVTDDFMARVREGTDYPLVNPHSQEVVGYANAREVFDDIVDQAWRSGEPGFIFTDRINRDNPTPRLGSIDYVSGCGEQPLLPYECCHLGSINLAKMVRNDGNDLAIDYDRLAEVVSLGVRFLDDAIDASFYPSEAYEQATKRTRKIGLGVMGFADLLFQLGVPYDSEEALVIAKEIMGFIREKSYETSSGLAWERGVFPVFDGSVYDNPGGALMRNATCNTIAPTGTISLIAGCSSGIEPAYAMVFVRNALRGQYHLLDINPYFENALKKANYWTLKLLHSLLKDTRLSATSLPSDLKRIYVTAHDIDPEWHVRMQAAFQYYTDNAVSKTVNLPVESSRQTLASIFTLAHGLGLKGITVYRDDTRQEQPFCTGEAGIKLIDEKFELDQR